MLPKKLFLVFFCLDLIQVKRAALIQAGSNISDIGGFIYVLFYKSQVLSAFPFIKIT